MSAVEPTGVADFDAIMWGWKWDVTDMTFSFPTSTSQYDGYASILGFQTFNTQQQTAVRQIMAEISSFTGLNITFNSNPNVVSHFRFGEATTLDYGDGQGPRAPGGGSAEGNPPDPTQIPDHAWGDTWYNRNDYNAPLAGTFAYAAGLMHEIGHALGLAHGMDTQVIDHQGHTHVKPVLPTDHNSQEYTVMTYRTFKGDGRPDPDQDFTVLDYPQSFMLNDIGALQIMYGADYSFNSGATTYVWSPTTGRMSVNGVAQAPVASGNLVFRTIWDGGGVDTYNFANYTTNLVINLNPGEWTITSQAQLAFLGRDANNVAQYARGNIANAYMFPNDVRSLIENANGGSGNDSMTGNMVANRLNGNAGADHMRGLAGNDTYVVDNAADIVNESVAGSSGIDTVQSSISFSLANTARVRGAVENLVLFGTAPINAIGNGLANALTGNDAANTLNGGAGADTMRGLDGNDIYYVDNVGDIVNELGSTGVDIVRSVISFSLASATKALGAIEQLFLFGSGDIDATGSKIANVLTGNGGDNVLHDGGAGRADRMSGLAGNDTYRIFNSGDIIVEAASHGTADRVVAAVDYRLESGVHIEIMTTNGSSGTSGIDVVGNEFAQEITGNGGANRLEGKGGNDVLRGLGGDDTFVFASVLGSGNVDTIADFRAVDDRFLLSDAIFTALTPGVLSTAAFRANTTGLAQDATDRIVYETDTGELYYDANGSAAGGGILFAKLTGLPTISHLDFSIA